MLLPYSSVSCCRKLTHGLFKGSHTGGCMRQWGISLNTPYKRMCSALTAQNLQPRAGFESICFSHSWVQVQPNEPGSQQTHIVPAQIGHSLISSVLSKYRCLKQQSHF